MKERVKLIAIVIVVLLTVIVVVQNVETVETKILFVSVPMPLAALLFGVLAVGFVAGLVAGHRLRARRKK